jgi:tRNA(fMet)-specific endonuclease VapC
MGASHALYILDSYALLAYLAGEAGAPRVREILLECARGQSQACLSLINLGEVLYITEREVGLVKAQEALAAVEQLPLEVLPATRDAVLAAAHVKARFRVSYADAFAVATAQERGGVAVTGDPEFEAVMDLVQVQWLGRFSALLGWCDRP